MKHTATKWLALFMLLQVFAGCTRTIPSELSKYGAKAPFITMENRDLAQKLAPKFPDEAFYSKETEVLVEFYFEDEKGKRKKNLRKSGDEEIDETMKTELKAKVTYFHSVLALKDYADYSDYIFYNDLMHVSPIYFTYEGYQDNPSWKYKATFSTSYEVDGMFYTDARMKFFNADIPAQGTELNYTYSVDYDNVTYLTNLYFLEGMPAGKKNITFKVPDWLELDVLEKNLEKFNVVKSEKRLRSSRILEFRDQLEMGSNDEEEEEEGRGRRRGRRKRVKYNYIQFDVKDLPAAKNEPYASGPTHQLPHVLIALKKYKNEKDEEKQILESVSDLYAWYHSLVKGVENDTSKVKEQALKLTEGLDTDEEKVKAVFYWIQDNVRYIAYEDGIAGFKPEACQSVFDNRYGDCKGMANLLTQMLRTLGYDARLTWIGTRRIAYDYAVPSLAVDNHMICTLILDGKHYFLDPTEDFIEMGDYAHRIQGRQVLIENGDTFILDTIPNLSYERNKNDKSEIFSIDANNDLVGKVKETYRGESKTNLLRFYNELKSDRRATALERYLNDQNTNLRVNNIQHSTFSDRTKDIVFDYDLVVKNHVLKVNDQLLVKLDWVGEFTGLKLDTTRISDVDLGYKVFNNVTRTVTIPAGYKLKYAPKKIDETTKDYRILIEYKQEGNTLKFTKTIIFFNGIIPVEQLDEWNTLHQSMSKFYSDFVVLSK